MVELPKTEAELQALIDASVSARETELKAEHDKAFASQRTKYESQIKSLKEGVGKSAEELAQQKIKEQQEQDQQELNELRAYKKSTILGEKLAKENLPIFLKNDTRLLNADEAEVDKIIKDIKKEYEASLPTKGNPHSTIVPTGGKAQTTTDKDKANEAFGQALKELIGR